MDNLDIIGLRANTKIGIHSFEQKIIQPLFIDISIPYDLSQCQETLDNTIDYAKVCHLVTTFVEGKHFYLIETVANEIAALIKAEFHVEQIKVCVSKPTAIANAKDIRVTVVR